jgi:hypothetical protein
MKSRRGLAVARRVGGRLAAFAYLAALGGFLLQSALGDSTFFPVSYFFTWDMFPSHSSQSFRRVALGETASGRYLQLYPSPREQFHRGAHGDLARLDLDKRVFFYRTVVEQTLREYSGRESDDPVKHVYLLEKYWPVKFNYPAGLYEAWSGTPRPERVAWRLVTEFDTGLKEAPAKLMADELAGVRP